MTIDEIRDFVAENITSGTHFQYGVYEDREFGYLQGYYLEACVVTGVMEEQRTRKWRLSPHMKESEIVQTALGLALASAEHVVREHFLYKGEQVFSPHFSTEALLEAARQRKFEVRDGLPVAAVKI